MHSTKFFAVGFVALAVEAAPKGNTFKDWYARNVGTTSHAEREAHHHEQQIAARRAFHHRMQNDINSTATMSPSQNNIVNLPVDDDAFLDCLTGTLLVSTTTIDVTVYVTATPRSTPGNDQELISTISPEIGQSETTTACDTNTSLTDKVTTLAKSKYSSSITLDSIKVSTTTMKSNSPFTTLTSEEITTEPCETDSTTPESTMPETTSGMSSSFIITTTPFNNSSESLTSFSATLLAPGTASEPLSQTSTLSSTQRSKDSAVILQSTTGAIPSGSSSPKFSTSSILTSNIITSTSVVQTPARSITTTPDEATATTPSNKPSGVPTYSAPRETDITSSTSLASTSLSLSFTTTSSALSSTTTLISEPCIDTTMTTVTTSNSAEPSPKPKSNTMDSPEIDNMDTSGDEESDSPFIDISIDQLLELAALRG